LSTTLVRFDKNCGTFGEGKNSMSSTTLSICLGKKRNYVKKKKTTMGWMLA
jgi:hypothetical protein